MSKLSARLSSPSKLEFHKIKQSSFITMGKNSLKSTTTKVDQSAQTNNQKKNYIEQHMYVRAATSLGHAKFGLVLFSKPSYFSLSCGIFFSSERSSL